MLTKQRDLRTGRSVWEANDVPPVPHRRLAKDVSVDVLVIGAGISGAMTAEALSEAGFGVLVVDRRGPIKGSTPASTALLQYEIDTPLTELAGQIGERDAARAWRRSRLALDGLRAKLRELGVETESRDSLYLAGTKLGPGGLRKEAAARRSIGLETRLLGKVDLKEQFGLTRDAALLSYDNLACDPRRMTAAFLNAAVASGAEIHAPTRIDAVGVDGKRLIAYAGDGPRIRCRWIVFATGYELPTAVPAKGHRISSTWAIATVPQPDVPWPEEPFIWEASEPYLYLRTTRDRRVICGGEDMEIAEAGKRDSLIERKTAVIAQKLGRLMPHLDTTVDYAWTGSFGASETGLPTIGPLPGLPNAFAVLGYGGNGITYSRIAAELIRTRLTGGEDFDADLYAFH